jgi:hypothetical protein
VKRALAACLLALLIAVAGCGSATSQSGATDPASVAPANTLAYASFDMSPAGTAKSGFDAAFGKLLGPDPETQIGDAFTKAVETSGKLDWQTDVKPWLAGRVAVAVTSVGDHSCNFALLMPSSDDGQAQAAIDKDLAGVHTRDAEYRDVHYKLQGDGTANGIVDHAVVAGTETAFKDVVDGVKDGKTLAASDQFKTTVGDRGDGKAGLAYVDAKALLQSLASNLPGMQRVAAPILLGMADIHPFVATLDAQPDALIVDAASPGTKPDPRGPAAASSPLIESMPARAWFAAAVPDVGAALGKVVTALEANPLIGGQVARVSASVRAQTGIDLQKDVIDGLGDVGMFARGKKAVVVAQPNKPGALDNLMARLPTLVPDKARKHVRFRTGVNARSKLGDTVFFKKATALVGNRPSMFVNVAPALALAAQAPHHRRDAHFKRALPHLRHVDFVAAGARRDGDLDVLRGVVGIH